MSTNVSTRTLRSYSRRLQAFPTETLLHIFSYCGQSTLVALSLVSFGCWELAGPILYQNVEINDLEGLASLFFIEIVPSSTRLQQATSLLSRIKSLSISIRSWNQTILPLFLDPDLWAEKDEDSGPYDSSFPPYRLLAYTDEPLPLPQLILPDWLPHSQRLQNFLPSAIFSYLNPHELTFRRAFRHFETFYHVGCMFSPFFLQEWTNLRRIVTEGEDVICMFTDDDEEWMESLLITIWARIFGEASRGISYVFDSTSSSASFVDRVRTNPWSDVIDLDLTLDHRRELQEVSGLMDLTVVLKLRGEDETIAKAEVAKLERWLRELVRVEVV